MYKTCLIGLLIRSILRGKNAQALQREIFQRKIERINSQQDTIYFDHSSALYTSNRIMKMWINNAFKAHTSTGNRTGNSRCHVLASRALWVTPTWHRLCYEACAADPANARGSHFVVICCVLFYPTFSLHWHWANHVWYSAEIHRKIIHIHVHIR